MFILYMLWFIQSANTITPDEIIKVVVIGDQNVGKTSFINRFVSDVFLSDEQLSTIPNTNWYSKTVTKDGKTAQFTIFDTDSTSHYRHLIYPETDVFLVLLDIASRSSYESVKSLYFPEIATLAQQNIDPAKIYIIGTKTDYREQDITQHVGSILSLSDGQTLTKFLGSDVYMECSAKTGFGVDEIFDYILDTLVSLRCRTNTDCAYGNCNNVVRDGAVFRTEGSCRSCGASCTSDSECVIGSCESGKCRSLQCRYPLHRYYSPVGCDHFYTLNGDHDYESTSGYFYERIECELADESYSNAVNLYRYYHTTAYDHYYTTAFSNYGDWVYEGIEGKCFPSNSEDGVVPLYEYWNPTVVNHFYTTTSGSYGGYEFSKILCYVFPIDSNTAHLNYFDNGLYVIVISVFTVLICFAAIVLVKRCGERKKLKYQIVVNEETECSE